MQQACAGKGRQAQESEGSQVKQAASGEQREEKVKGVLRNLQEGHFKGVADARLRINFFDELAATERDSLGAVLEEEIPALLEDVVSELDTLLDSEALDEAGTATLVEVKMTFTVSVEQSVADFTEGTGIDFGSMLEGIQSAFDSLLESLEPLLTALSGAEEGGEDTAAATTTTTVSIVETVTVMEAEAVVPTDESGALGETEVASASEEGTADTDVLSSFLDDLQSVFDNAMQRLEEALNAASTLPDLSEPTGNGAAYSKFVAMYEELRIGVTMTSTAGEEQPIDTVA